MILCCTASRCHIAWCIFFLFNHLEGSQALKMGTEVCSLPLFPHGKVFYSIKTGVITFKCRKKYRLLGQSESLCEKGKIWYNVPFCAQAGCSTKISSHHGLVVHNEQGLRMSFTCAKEDHELVGDRILACDGDSWNGSIPFCRRVSFNLSPECEPFACPDWKPFGFEVGHETPSRGTGPLGREDKPFFYLESSNKGLAYMESEEMETDKVACVRVEYLMRGATMGHMEVVQVYDDLSQDTILKVKDEQGNEWKTMTALVKSPSTGAAPFYFKLSAVRGNGYLSDIAIRKIQVFRSKEDCSSEKDDPLRHPIRQISPSSCYDRCHTNVEALKALWTEGICSCQYPECRNGNECCKDVHEECQDKKVTEAPDKDPKEPKGDTDHSEYYTSLGITVGLFLLVLSLGVLFVYKCCPAFKEGIESPFNPPQPSSDIRSVIQKRSENPSSLEEGVIEPSGIPSSEEVEAEYDEGMNGVFGQSCISSLEDKEVNPIPIS